MTAKEIAARLLEMDLHGSVPAENSKPKTYAVDLDGTLAEHDPDAEFDPEHIGPPIPAMMEQIKAWLAQGDKVVIFTARAAEPANIPPIKKWLEDNGLPDLEVTNEKTPEMSEFWDDRAVEVEQNTGLPPVSVAVLKVCGLQ